MSLLATLRVLIDAGSDHETLYRVVEAHLAERDAKEAAFRAKNAERMKTVRERARTNAHVHERSQRARTQSTRVEDNIPSLEGPCVGSEAKASSPTPLGRQAIHRGTRLPADWQPSETDIAFGLQEGLTREEIARGADEFRDYWCALPGTRGLKLDWVRTFRNRLRELAGRKQRDGARLAARQGSGGGGRSVGSFADEFVRRHGSRPD